MNWLRARLRQWLGIDESLKPAFDQIGDLQRSKWQRMEDAEFKIGQLEERSKLAWERIVAIEQLHGEISSKQNELKAILTEVRQLRELLTDPKRVPVVAKTTHQFRALMEQEI
jgi:anion-transporting  ArsA/GET3 family ATPase